jgi:thiol:disulfide interchange protein DsbC
MFASRLILVLGALVAAAIAFPTDASDAIKTALRKRYPDLQIESIRKTDFGGLLEVVIDGAGGKEIVYTNDKANFLLVGQIIDEKKENVTDKRMRQLTAVKWQELPLGDAIKIVRGDGSRKVAVFSDPYCGFCRRFEADLVKIDNVTVYTFLLPIIRAESAPLSKKVWCSKDRGQAWLDLMLKEVQPTGDGACDTPVDRNLAFGQRFKITGTPTMFFENGERTPGALSQADIEANLVRASGKKS